MKRNNYICILINITIMKSTLRYKVKYEFNPLTDKTELVINKDKKLCKFDQKSIILNIELKKQEVITRYVKFICSSLKLSKKAEAILVYIFNEKNRNDDRISVDMDMVKQSTGYNSLGPLYAGLNELVEHELIARTMYNDQYFVNPSFILPKISDVGIFTNLNTNVYTEPEKAEEVLKQVVDDDLPDGFDENDKMDF